MQTGSEEAFTTLYLHYSPRLYINILRLVKDPILAEEMVQELFTKVWHKRDSKGIAENFAGYIYRIGQNLVHDFFRKLKRDRILMEKFRAMAEENYVHIEEDLLSRQTAAMLEKAVAQLSPQQKRVYDLIKVKGHTYKEAAAIMGISPQTVKEYMVATNKSLRNYFLNHTDMVAFAFLILMFTTVV
jgi:RNA polymerase sigma factor (sigma-70 family)